MCLELQGAIQPECLGGTLLQMSSLLVGSLHIFGLHVFMIFKLYEWEFRVYQVTKMTKALWARVYMSLI